jgi:uncharacterized membrane protein YfcA
VDFVLVALVATGVSGLTLYSGFGLGTLLMPVFALFFPVEVAVAATAVVHGANNIFKLTVVGRQADRQLVLRFGIPAIIAAFVGAAALGYVSHFQELGRYELAGRAAIVTPIKLAMGLLMLFFALFELLPRFRNIRFQKEHLLVGGLLSGFFGGFSGHQGALRSAFLVKSGVSTEAFVGTNAVIGFLVDLARILVYGALYFLAGTGAGLGSQEWPLVITGALAAFVGVLLGKRFLHKVTMAAVQTLTGILLVIIALALGSGLI